MKTRIQMKEIVRKSIRKKLKYLHEKSIRMKKVNA